MQKQGTQQCRQVVLVPCPLQGHLSPMLELGTVLHSNGFSIIIVHTPFNAPNPSEFSNFIFLPILDNLSAPDPTPGNLITFVRTINTHCEAPLRKLLTQMKEQHEPHDKTICVIYDTLMYFSVNVATSMKLPSIVLRPSSASSTHAYNTIPQLHAEGFIPLQDSMLENPVPRLHPLRFKDLSLSEIGNIEDTLQIIATTRNIGNSSAIIWNTIDFLEGSSLSHLREDYQVPIFTTGPLHKMAPTSSTSLLKEDTSCIPWLDKQAPRSVIYISLGSLASFDEKELAEMAWGLANSGQPFLWVVRPGQVNNSEWVELLLEGFKEIIAERGCIVKWAPQKKVLAHSAIGGFLSHCGWNSTLESICEGIPMICMPCFADQKVNARYVSHAWRTGLQLEHELKRDGIEKAIKMLMLDKGDEMRRRATDMKEKVDLSLKEGGSSYHSVHELVELLLSF